MNEQEEMKHFARYAVILVGREADRKFVLLFKEPTQSPQEIGELFKGRKYYLLARGLLVLAEEEKTIEEINKYGESKLRRPPDNVFVVLDGKEMTCALGNG